MKLLAAAIAAALLAGCGTQQQHNRTNAERQTPASAPSNVQQTAIKPSEVLAETPSAHRPLAEPRGPIDSKSVEAAGQIVQHYGALIEQQQLGDAAKLWRDAAAANAFAKQLRGPGVRLEIGELGATEGAAGSIYTTVPVTFTDAAGRRPAGIILRRTNDVPGSTAEQRQWHIDRIEWAAR